MFSLFKSPEERIFHKMGYFRDQAGILRRYRRERDHWEEHLRNTRRFACQSAEGKEKHAAMVLGSGWLLDVPVEELSGQFKKVTLMDIKHPAAVRKRVQKIGNVELLTGDISGFALPVYWYTRKYRNAKNRPPIGEIQPEPGPALDGFDFIFSCNILNQLDILLIDYLREYFVLDAEETVAFRKKVQQHHIDILPVNRSCLVFDYEEILYTPSGKEISRKPSVFQEIKNHPEAAKWTWEFDTRMRYYEGKKTHFSVMGIEIVDS